MGRLLLRPELLADSRNLTEKGGLLPAFFQELWGHRKTIFHLLKELVQNKETKDDIRNEALSMYNIIEYQHKNSLRIAVVGHIINYFESSEATYLKGFLEYFKREGISHLKGFFDCYGHILNDSDLNSRDFQDFLSEIWGSIIQFLEKFAQNKNIDDDVRAEALSLVLMMRDQLEADKKLPLQVDVCSKEAKTKRYSTPTYYELR